MSRLLARAGSKWPARRGVLVVALAVVLLAILVPLVAEAPVFAAPGEVLAVLEREPGEGISPTYRVTVHVDGVTEWEAMPPRDPPVLEVSRLTREQLIALRAAFAAARFMELRDEYSCAAVGVVDPPSARLTFQNAWGAHTLDDCLYPEDPSLETLEKKFDLIVGSAEHFGFDQEWVEYLHSEVGD